MRFVVWWLGVLVAVTSCDPAYEYCVTVTDCRTAEPLANIRVHFEHEGLYDGRTDAEGNACSGSVGGPREPHTVTVVLEKDGYRGVVKSVRHGGGDEFKADLCLCKLTDQACREDSSNAADSGAEATDAAPEASRG